MTLVARARRPSHSAQSAFEHLLHPTRHPVDVERRAAVDLDRKELLPRRSIRQERVNVPPRVDLVSRFRFVHRAKTFGHIGRVEDGEVEAAMAYVDLWRPDARSAPIHYAGQPLARP